MKVELYILKITSLRICLLLLSGIFFHANQLHGQNEKKTGFISGYSLTYNGTPLKSWNNDIVEYKFTHGINLFWLKENSKNSGLFLGLNYEYMFGESEINNGATLDCNNQVVNISWYYQSKINVINGVLGFQFRPITNWNNFLLRTFLKTGGAFYHYYDFYTPETCYYQSSESKGAPRHTFSTGFSGLNKIKLSDRFSLGISYGLVYQYIDLTIRHLNAFGGLELNF